MSFRLAKYFAAGLASIACSTPAFASTLDWEIVGQKKVEKVVLEGRCFVAVSGFSGESSKAVSRVDVSVENGKAEIHVQVKLVPSGSSVAIESSVPLLAPPGSSANFEILIPLRKPEVRQILFGASKAVVWKNDGTKNDCEKK